MQTKKLIPTHSFIAAALAVLTVLVLTTASAATYYWDNDGTTPGFGTAAGTWAAPTTGNSSQGWSTDSTGSIVPGNVTTTTNDALSFGTSSAGLVSGTISVSGTVEANSITIGSTSPNITLNGGTIALGGTAPQFRVNSTNHVVNSALRMDADTSVLMGVSNILTLSLNGSISGNSNLTFTTAAVNFNNLDQVINLGAASTYTGDTTITTANTANRLRIKNTSGAANALPVTTVLTLDGGNGSGTGRNLFYDLNSQSQTLAGLVSIQRTSRNQQIVNTGNGAVTLTISNANNYVFRGNISGTGISLVKTGTGTQTFTNNNAYNGTTTINAGKLEFVVGGSCSNSTVTLNATTATNSVSITDNTKSWTCAALAPAAAGVIDFNFGSVPPSTSVSPLNILGAANFSAATPTVTIQGTSLTPGTYPLMSWTSLSGTAPTTATVTAGGTGTLFVSNSTTLYVTYAVSAPTTVVKANNTTNLNLGTSWVGSVVPSSIDRAVWNATVTSANTTMLGGDLNWSGMTIANPNGLVTINAGNTLTLGGSGVTNIDLSTATADLTLNCGVALGNNNLWDVTNSRTLTVGGIVSGNKSITKQGGGALVLTNANTFTGGLTNLVGTLKLGGASGNVIPNANFVTLAGGTLDLSDTSETINELFVTGPVTMMSSGSGTGVLTATNTATAQGATTSSTDFTLQNGTFSGKYWRNNGKTTIAGGTLELNQAGSEVLNGFTTGGAVFNLNSGLLDAQQVSCGNSPCTYNFNGGMVKCGIFKIRGAGTFDLFFNGTTIQPWISADPTYLPQYSPSYGATVNYSVQPGQNAWISTNGMMLDTSVATNLPIYINIDLQHDASLGVALDGGFTKIGTGGVVLSSNCTYTGSTIVSNGTLLVNGTIATSPVSVHAGATLGGTGTIGGTVTVNSGGTLAPGASIGTLTLNGNLVLNAGSTNTFEVNGTTPANDQVALGAAVTYGGVLKIIPTGTFTNGQQFTLFSGLGATSPGNFSSIVVNPSGPTFSFTNGVLTVVSAGGPTGPGTITNSLSGNILTLTWPAGQNWTLKCQTNNLSTGLNPETNAWFAVPGGIDGSNSITIDPANPTVFYRLVYP